MKKPDSSSSVAVQLSIDSKAGSVTAYWNRDHEYPIMPTTITTTLPNPDCTEENNSAIWDHFIAEHSIQTAGDSVIRRYQNLESNQAEFMDSNELSHYLTAACGTFPREVNLRIAGVRLRP